MVLSRFHNLLKMKWIDFGKLTLNLDFRSVIFELRILCLGSFALFCWWSENLGD